MEEAEDRSKTEANLDESRKEGNAQWNVGLIKTLGTVVCEYEVTTLECGLAVNILLTFALM